MFPDQISNLGARFIRLQKTNDLFVRVPLLLYLETSHGSA